MLLPAFFLNFWLLEYSSDGNSMSDFGGFLSSNRFIHGPLNGRIASQLRAGDWPGSLVC